MYGRPGPATRVSRADPNDGEIAGLENAPSRVRANLFLPHGIAHVAADDVDDPGAHRGNDVAVGRHAAANVVVGGAAARSSAAHEVAHTRRCFSNPVRLDWVG